MSEDRSQHPGEYTTISNAASSIVTNAVLIGGGGAGYSADAPEGRMDASHSIVSKSGQISGGLPSYGAPDSSSEQFAGPGGAGLLSNGSAGFKDLSLGSTEGYFAFSVLKGAVGGRWTEFNSNSNGAESEEGDGGFGGGASGAKSVAEGAGCGGPGGGYSGGGACGATNDDKPFSGGAGSFVGSSWRPMREDQTSAGFSRQFNSDADGYVRIWFLRD